MKALRKSLLFVTSMVAIADPAHALDCSVEWKGSMYSVGNNILRAGGEFVKKDYFGIAQFGDQDPQKCEISAGNYTDVERLAPWAGNYMFAFQCQGKRIRRDLMGYEIQDSSGTWHRTVNVGGANARRVCNEKANNTIKITDPLSYSTFRIAGTDKTFSFGIGEDFFYKGKAVGSFGF